MLKAPKGSSSGEQKTDFLPSEGAVSAVCVGMWETGQWKNKFADKIQDKLLIQFEVNEQTDAGENKTINFHRTFSMFGQAALAKLVCSWLGKSLSQDQLEDFDLETLIGKSALITVEHTESNGRTYANIASICPLPKGMPEIKPNNLYDNGEVPTFINKIRAKSINPNQFNASIDRPPF